MNKTTWKKLCIMGEKTKGIHKKFSCSNVISGWTADSFKNAEEDKKNPKKMTEIPDGKIRLVEVCFSI